MHLWDDVYTHGNFWMLYEHGDGSGPFCVSDVHASTATLTTTTGMYAVFDDLSDARLKKM